MKIVFISDTHGFHDLLKLPVGDVIIHAGDVSGRGTRHEIEVFLQWFDSLDFKYKIFIAGNHDFFFETADSNEIKALIPKGIIYLNDSGATIEGLNIWGSPIQPWFHDWAFNRKRGKQIKEHWNKIPENLDILITHGPPKDILDITTGGEAVGCEDLADTVFDVKPKIHVFGHIHEAYGVATTADTQFINASVLNINYQLANAPVEVVI